MANRKKNTDPKDVKLEDDTSEEKAPKKRGRKKKDPSEKKEKNKSRYTSQPSLDAVPIARDEKERAQGKAHEPFKNAHDWVEVIQRRFTSKDRNIIATITPEPHGTYDLTINFGSFFSIEEAEDVANLQILVAMDEHGHSRAYEDFDFDAFHSAIGKPKMVEFKEKIPDIAEEFYSDEDEGVGD